MTEYAILTPTSIDEIIALTDVARDQLELAAERAPVADAYAVCAADQVALGDIVHAYHLAERAAALHTAYTPVRDRLYTAEWGRGRAGACLDDATLDRLEAAQIEAVARWAAEDRSELDVDPRMTGTKWTPASEAAE